VAKVASKFANGNSGSNSRRVEFDCTLKNHFKTQSNKNMNAKQTVPLIATLAPFAPILVIGGGIFLLLKCLLSTEDKKNKPETPPANAGAEFRVKPAAAPAVVPLTKDVAQASPPPPIKREFVTREDIATIFQRGARTLTRTAAVAALKKIGFGKTAAYAALLEDGRFASWLQFAPDGIITWKG
jgi:hypothetical protein